MGFRRIRNQPKVLRTEHDKLQATYKIPDFRQEVYHSTVRTGSIAYTEPTPDHPEYTTSEWDELRMNFHSYGADSSGLIFAILWQKLYGNPATDGKNAWGNTLTKTNFRWSRFNANIRNYRDQNGVLRDKQLFNYVNEISGSDQRLIHRARGTEDPPGYPTDYYFNSRYGSANTGGTFQWGEIRVSNPEASAGGDGRFWFYVENQPGSPDTAFSITKVQVFKYGVFVNEYPLEELYLPPVNGVVPTPNLSSSGTAGNTVRQWWTRNNTISASSIPTTFVELSSNYYPSGGSTSVPQWEASGSYGGNTWGYFVDQLNDSTYATSGWPTNWDQGPRGLGDDNIATPGGNGILNGYTPYLSIHDEPGPTSLKHTCISIAHRGTYTNPSNDNTDATITYVNPEP